MHMYSRYFGEGNGNPLQYSCLGNPVGRGAWWAAVHRVAQSRTGLKRCSSSNRYDGCRVGSEDQRLNLHEVF